MKVALVYDRVNKLGGAERVLASLHELFPQAPLYTSVFHDGRATWAKDFTIKTSYLQHIPGASSSHEYFAPLMPSAFEQFSFDEYDVVISVTSEAAKGIITKPGTKHICYCLTPTRYLWSGYAEYFANPLLKLVAKPAVSYLRTWDTIAAQKPDVMVAISEEVRKRIKTYYGREAKVLYPALPELRKEEKTTKSPLNEPYFLVVSRLVPYKKVELAIQACSELQHSLVVVGTGSEEQRLRALSGPTIHFAGGLTDRELSQYYEHSKALIFPGEEDFGLTILEAQSFGKPVIAYAKGGALETIIDHKTGLFFTEQTSASLTDALRRFEATVFEPKNARNQAERFNQTRFKKEFRALVDQVVSKSLTW